MKTYSAPVLAALSSSSLAIVQMIANEFSSTPLYLNTSTWDLTYDGNVYQGAYGLGSISGVTDKPGQVQGLTFDLFGDSSGISLALDASDIVQGTPCTIRTAIIETTDYTVLDAPTEWVGSLDTMTLGEDGQQASIHVTAESRAVDLMRGTPWRYIDEEQKLINATDASFAFVVDQIGKPIVWPTKSYFEK